MSKTSQKIFAAIRSRLRTGMQRVTMAEVVFGLLLTTAAALAFLLVAFGAEALLWLGTGLRSLLFWGFLIGLVTLIFFYVARPLFRFVGILPGLDERTAAQKAGIRHTAVGDRLITMLDLAEGRASTSSSSLVDHAITALGDQMSPLPIEQIEDHSRTRKVAPWAVMPLLGLMVFFLAAPGSFKGAAHRFFEHNTEFARPAPFVLHVDPGNTELSRGETLEISVRPVGRDIPPNALLEFRRQDEELVEQSRMEMSSDSLFEHTLPNLRADTRYRIIAGNVFTEWYSVSITERPLIRRVQVSVSPPGYTGLSSETLTEGVGNVLGLPGSRVQLELATSGTTIDSAIVRIRWMDGRNKVVPIRMDGEAGQALFPVRDDGVYSIHLMDVNGRSNRNPIEYTIGTLEDAPPHISRIGELDETLSDESRRDVRFRITDDYGFSSASLYWKIVERREGNPDAEFRRVSVPISSVRNLDQEITVNWLLSTSNGALQRGDVVSFFGEVRDNDAVNGFKTARTPVFTLRYPSLGEQYDRLEETQDQAEESLDELEDDSEELRDRFEELRDEIRRDPDPNWEDERQLQHLLEQHESVQQQAQSLTDQMQDLLQQMEEGQLVTEETMQLYDAMQQVMDELNSPELREALEMLREAMEQMDMQQMIQSLEDIEFNEEEFRQRIERAMNLFEQLRTAQKLDEAARRAEDLAERERDLQESTEQLQRDSESGERNTSEQAEERSRLTQEQQSASEEMTDLQEMMEELLEQMQSQQSAPQDQAQELQEQLEQQDLSEQMQQNAQQLEQNQLSPAQEGQNQMEQQLRQMSEQMQSMSQQMMSGRQQASISGLRRILDDVLTLSYEQENLGNETQELPSRSPALRPIAQQQVELATGLSTVADSLQSLAQTVPQLGAAFGNITRDALREMQQATEQLADQNSGPAAGHQKTAMTHLNELALMISELLDQMQNGSGSGTGMSMQQMMQQMQQMGQQQQGLNQMMQQMLNDMAGERLTQSEQERMRQAAAQQEAIRQQLQEMLREGGGNLDSQTRSALQRAEEEMREAARQMRNGNLDRETLPRQQNILHRLLQAQDAINRRGREERREGQTGEDTGSPDRPDQLDTEESPTERIRRDLIRALERGYAPDYENLIRRYFEQLQQRAG